MLEFGDGQAETLAALFRAQGWTVQHILPDLSKRQRILIAAR